MPAQTLFSRRWLPMRNGVRIRAVSFHALRHTAAALALEDGQPPHVVAAMLGHASVAMRVLSEKVLAQRNRNWRHCNGNGVPRKGIEPSQACSKRSEEAPSELEGAARRRHVTP
jgi:hypothetical protein